MEFINSLVPSSLVFGLGLAIVVMAILGGGHQDAWIVLMGMAIMATAPMWTMVFYIWKYQMWK